MRMEDTTKSSPEQIRINMLITITNSNGASVVARGLVKHDLGVFVLALAEHSRNKGNLLLANHDFNFILHELDQALFER